MWCEDISLHNSLMLESEEILGLQTELMNRIRVAKEQAMNTVSFGMVKDQLKISGGAETLQDEAELAELDRRSNEVDSNMRTLEGRILTYETVDTEEVAIQLQFLSGVLRNERKIDSEYLADLLEEYSACVHTAQSRRQTRTHEPMFQHAAAV